MLSPHRLGEDSSWEPGVVIQDSVRYSLAQRHAVQVLPADGITPGEPSGKRWLTGIGT